jgi:hypothetical protein
MQKFFTQQIYENKSVMANVCAFINDFWLLMTNGKKHEKNSGDPYAAHSMQLCIFEKGRETKSIHQVLPFLGYFLPIE